MEPNASASTTSMKDYLEKRKIDDAFDALDDALQPRDRPPPPGRANNSIYGSLTKYGIRTFNKPFPKLPSTPTLSALLARSRSKKQQKAMPFFTPSSSSLALPDYSPSSTEAFLQRISTFTLSTYSSKPPQIDAVAASKAGWLNEGGKDRLFCAICKVGWIVTGRDGMNKEVGDALVEKQRQLLVEMHKEGCPWRVRQCDALVYRISLQSPTGLVRQIKAQATELESVMDGVAILHPLSHIQVQSLMRVICSVPDTGSVSSSPASPRSPDVADWTLLLTNPVLTSLFGWSLVPAPQSQIPKPSSASPLSYTRRSSVEHVDPPGECTPGPSASIQPTHFNTPVKGNGIVGNPVTNVESSHTVGTTDLIHREPPRQRDVLLHCRMCQRRVGLWAFTLLESSTPISPQQPASTNRPQRHFDILREHRSYCPYVVKSTPLPSITSYRATQPTPTTPRSSFNLTRTGTSSSLAEEQISTPTFDLRRTSLPSLTRPEGLPDGGPPTLTLRDHHLVEGWRAVLSVVLRFGMAERSRLETHLQNSTSAPASNVSPLSEDAEEGSDAMSGVVALVDGVKKHGKTAFKLCSESFELTRRHMSKILPDST